MKRFEDKTILVTGAGSGIGAACVRRLFAEGASIVAADVRKEEVDKVVFEFGNSERIYGAGVDVSDRDQWPRSNETFDGGEIVFDRERLAV
jgi:NADP-dependent 3-hydroxy acid dehydrogenase YdfG